MLKNIMNALKVAAVGLIAVAALSGCSASKNVLYLQDLTPGETVQQISQTPITVEPGDEIMIYVSCSDAEMAGRLSLISGTRRPQLQDGLMISNSTAAMVPYTVNTRGCITMPEIGEIKVAGLTRQQISALIEQKVIDSKLVKDNSINVTVQFANLTFTTMGEIKNVGTYNIAKDNLTILEAIAAAGDLTIYGRRDAVWVIREQNDGTRAAYKLDLRSADFLTSPAYYVQQNDVIYVEPNSVRAGQSTINENTFKSAGFWTSMASIALSIATLVVTLTR